MPIVITDQDARRLLSINEAIEGMRVAFSDLATGRAVNPPRLRYSSPTQDATRRYFANIHAGAVQTYGAAIVRAGSHFMTVEASSAERRTLSNPDPVNWTIIILYSLKNGEPLAFMHETHLSGFRVGATTGLAVQQSAREDAEVLGLFGTGNQAFPNCRAICAVRPIKKVKVYSPSAAHREAFRERMKNEPMDVILVEDPREVVRGSHIVCCATNSKKPVLQGDWLEPGQMVISICNSDVVDKRHEVDERTFARASDIIINDWDSVHANKQTELLDPIAKGLVDKDRIYELGDIAAGKVSIKQSPNSILYYKNNTGLAIQFVACGAILYQKMISEGGANIIPAEWLASEQYSISRT